MSQAEAQARFLAALAARAYSDEQMRLVRAAKILDSEGVVQVERSLAQIPSAQLKGLIETMAATPTMLEEKGLGDLASVLGRRGISN